MRTAEELTSLWRDHGMRVTPQRQAIFRLLHDNDRHPTVDALYDAARVEMPTISLKTVYQTVHELEAMGEVSLLDLGTGSVRVDPNVDFDHHHLVCTSCGLVRDVPLAEVPRLPARHRQGFTADAVEVIFRGLCESCG
jgi:Fe2+ or Zn2+ uptake regulation protein